ncbi:MAG: ECF transporter S component [Oscillospiraceae bacterium]|nr:ECF transporter S component [Oscillospiraceae bacterium]
MKLSNIKRLTLSALCIALCVVLPMAFHVIPNAGSVMLPMHIPVLLCGLVCGWQYGLLCGILGPLVSSILTGMPPAAILPGMMVECGMYGCVGGLMMERIRTGSLYADLYISLPIAMLAGRVISGIVKALILTPGMSFSAWVAASFVTALPGISIQLILIPSLIVALTRAGLIPARYQRAAQYT